MPDNHDSVLLYTELLNQTDLQKGYVRIFEFLKTLRVVLMKRYPEDIFSQLYQGMMDMSYFAIIPESLKAQGLKFAIVYVHASSSVEVWLSGRNRKIQREWSRLLVSKPITYTRVNQEIGADAIVSHRLQCQPDFNHLKDSVERMLPEIEEIIADMKNIVVEIMYESVSK